LVFCGVCFFFFLGGGGGVRVSIWDSYGSAQEIPVPRIHSDVDSYVKTSLL